MRQGDFPRNSITIENYIALVQGYFGSEYVFVNFCQQFASGSLGDR
jgi:hypothetical protein